jgi:protein-S-isoprenylcysteine O-methyltransferase Ste14
MPAACSTDRPELPRSYGGSADPVLAVAAAFMTYALFRHRDLSDTGLSITIVLSIAGVLSAVEYVRVNNGLGRPRQTLSRLVARSLRQWLEAMIGLAFVIFFWWLVTAEYGRPMYKPLWEALNYVIAFAPAIVLFCVVFTEWRLGSIRDTSTPLIDCLLNPGTAPGHAELRQAILTLVVRAIFLPLNFCVLVRCIEHFRGREAYLFSAEWPGLHAEILTLIYGLLIAAIVPGYLFGSRLLATHTRQVDTTLLGWLATLACYRPLSLAVFDQWLNYRGRAGQIGSERSWIEHTDSWPGLLMGIGLSIILLELVHLWGEASFGLRASNLSNRGIISCGPFRYCKHPIYLSKCLGWLLLYMPFLAGSISDSFRSTLLFAAVCVLYTLRAYREERLLSQDPAYVDYALWIDSHGTFRWIAIVLPSMSFQSRLTRWQATSRITGAAS